MPSPDGTHQADYRKHLMRTSCPQGGKVALGTVWSGGSRWLTWLQAKWAKSPEASDPWKEKWGEVGGGRDSQGRGAGASCSHHPRGAGPCSRDGHRDG